MGRASPSGRWARWSRPRPGSWNPTRPRSQRRSSSEAVAALVLDERDREWVLRHLRPLVGLEAQSSASGGEWPGGGVRGLAALLRSTRRGRADRARVRGHPLGRRRPLGLHRPARRSGWRGAAADRLHCPARAVGAPRAWGGGKTNASTISLDPALHRGHRSTGRRTARPGAAARRGAAGVARPLGGQPACTPRSTCGCCKTAACSSRARVGGR